MIVTVSSPNFAGTTKLKEDWFDIDYSKLDFDSNLLKVLIIFLNFSYIFLTLCFFIIIILVYYISYYFYFFL